jgi:hypothetical protein
LPNNFGQPGFPTIGAALITPYGGTQFNYQLNQIISDIDENLTKTKGRHQMQFGGKYRHERFTYLLDRTSDTAVFGAYATALENPSSGANYTASSNTGYADGDAYLGAAASYAQYKCQPADHFHDMEFDAYFQDNYHVTRNLTMNIGLRWEAHPALWTKDGREEGFDLKNDAVVLVNPVSYYLANGLFVQSYVTNYQNIGVKFETPQQAGFPSTIVGNADFIFNPRVGLAYQPFGGKYGTVIRGAYGRYVYPVSTRSMMTQASNIGTTQAYSQSYTASNQSPDGLPNYLLRAPQTVVMGVNSSTVVTSAGVATVLPGGVSPGSWAKSYQPDLVTQMNFTIEQPLKGNSALRVSWVWDHGTNLDREYYYNNHPSAYVWETAYGTTTPTGTYSGSATGPYDQTTYGGGNSMAEKTGWSNDNALQANYERLFHHGSAYQITYVWSKPLRVGGYRNVDSLVYPHANYQGSLGSLGTMTSPFGTLTPGAVPPALPNGTPNWAEYHKLAVFEAYKIDSAIPLQRIRANGIIDLPVGRGKRFLSNSNRLLDELVGGFQLAGDFALYSQDYQPASSNWGPTNPLKTNKHNAPITDCRSGVCHASFLWFNGYIAPTALTAANGGTCTTKCVTGLPASYAPYLTPIDNTPGTTNYGTNNVQVALLNGSTVTVAYSPGPAGNNPYAKTFLHGPMNYGADLSLFKMFPITERVKMRLTLDAFNFLNVQGYNNPSTTDGTESLLSSANTPRQLQLTLRLSF